MTVTEVVRLLEKVPGDAQVEVCTALYSGVEITARLDAVECGDGQVTLVAQERGPDDQDR